MPASGNTISRKRQAAAPAAAKCIPVLKQYPTGVINQISPRDAMYDGPESYFANARQALDCVRLAALAAEKSKVWDLLDLPCGHGRILRMLKAEYPDARLTCCDIDRDGVDFCAKLFGARCRAR